MLTRNVESIEELISYLTSISSAYRKSYRLLSRLAKTVLIVSGIISSSAILAIIPVVPVAIAAVSVINPILMVIDSNLKLTKKAANYKLHYRKYKQLLTYVRMKARENEKEVISYVFSKALEFQQEENYVEPMERYMKRYKLNGYYIDDECE